MCTSVDHYVGYIYIKLLHNDDFLRNKWRYARSYFLADTQLLCHCIMQDQGAYIHYTNDDRNDQNLPHYYVYRIYARSWLHVGHFRVAN